MYAWLSFVDLLFFWFRTPIVFWNVENWAFFPLQMFFFLSILPLLEINYSSWQRSGVWLFIGQNGEGQMAAFHDHHNLLLLILGYFVCFTPYLLCCVGRSDDRSVGFSNYMFSSLVRGFSVIVFFPKILNYSWQVIFSTCSGGYVQI